MSRTIRRTCDYSLQKGNQAGTDGECPPSNFLAAPVDPASPHTWGRGNGMVSRKGNRIAHAKRDCPIHARIFDHPTRCGIITTIFRRIAMPRRSKPQREKRDWRWYASFALNAVVALSMVLGTVLVFSGAGRPAPVAPTIVPPPESASGTSPTPASAPTNAPAAPTPTPTPAASNLFTPHSSVAQNTAAVVISTAALFLIYQTFSRF